MSIKTGPNRKYVARDENINNKKNAFYISSTNILIQPAKIKTNKFVAGNTYPLFPLNHKFLNSNLSLSLCRLNRESMSHLHFVCFSQYLSFGGFLEIFLENKFQHLAKSYGKI